ncbi:hypothetical protein PHMEG_00014182 [Phytophthora megakarya]|uniref:M96 mating-specific protein n=1 Tax=Phytophthora megakarya TaxID=4795 RepID=A0A225W5I2_9STRA|nr:hypothetical protein PHMEG_00014182 [Phytophthora megakarya]
MDKQQRHKKRRNRVKDGVPYSSQLVRRKRLEAQTLQLEAEELTAQLVNLQARRRDVSTRTTLEQSSPRTAHTVTIEVQKLQQSQKMNRTLKVMLVELHKLCAPFAATLGKTNTLQDMEFVFNLRTKVDRPLVEIAFSDKVVNEMSMSLDWLRLDTDTMLAGVDCISNVSFRWHNFPARNCIEATSITPVGCSAQELGDMVWHHATNTEKDTDKAFHCIKRKMPNPLDMNAVAAMVEGLLRVNIVTTFRKYDEGNRIILVGTTKWFLPSGELLLQDYNWTVLLPSPVEPLRLSVMKIFYKLEMTATQSDRAAESQQTLFQAVSTKMRGFHLATQDNLLSS